jgi:hypothetical protein
MQEFFVEIGELTPLKYVYGTWVQATEARAVGWLGTTVPRTGPFPLHLLDALRFYSESNLLEDWTLGCHTCEVCDQVESHGQFTIDWAGVRYVLPLMVLHYIEAHAYLPPSEFLTALEACWSADEHRPTSR